MIDTLYNNDGKIRLKSSANLYENPSSESFVIKGTIIEKNGKNIRISTENNELFDVITKNNLDVQNGQTLKIKKSEVEMIKKVTDEKLEEEKKVKKEELEELKKLDLEDSDENMEAIENLKKYGVQLTKNAVEKFVYIKNLVSEIDSKVSIPGLLSVMSKFDNDINALSLTEFSKNLDNVDCSYKDIDESVNYYNNSSKMSYDEAREVSRKIYNSEMGKDIQDIVIALDSVGIELSRENIDKVHDIFAKMYDIKDIDNDSIMRAIKTEKSISINLLYNVKNYVVSSDIKAVKSVEKAEFIDMKKSLSDEDIKNLAQEIKKLLKEMNLEGENYEEIAKELIKNNIEIDEDTVVKIDEIRSNIEILQDVLGKDVAAVLMKSGIDIENMNIDDLLSLIKKIQAGLFQFDFMNLTKEDLDLGKEFVNAIKSLNSNTIISTDRSLARLLNSTSRGREFYNQVYGRENPIYISENDRYLLQQAGILNKIKSLDFTKIDYTRNDISLRYIAESQGLIEARNYMQNDSKLVKLNYSHSMDVSVTESQIKISLSSHYEYMRSNMRASHIYSMLSDNIDVFNSDIRVVSEFIKDEIDNATKLYNSFRNFDTFEINKIAAESISLKTSLNVGSFVKKLDLNSNTNNYIDNIKSFENFAKERGFEEVREKLDNIMKHLATNENMSRETLRENINLIYTNLKEVEKIIQSSDRIDKKEFVNRLRDTATNIRESEKQSRDQDMVQIPFYMQQESSNANVYAKSSKSSSSKKIDPEDMSVFIDLKTKNLGKMGFFMKVDKKNIRLKISGNSKGVNNLRLEIKSLSESFNKIGYNLDQVDLVTPENSAKIAFVEDTAPKSSSILDMMV